MIMATLDPSFPGKVPVYACYPNKIINSSPFSLSTVSQLGSRVVTLHTTPESTWESIRGMTTRVLQERHSRCWPAVAQAAGACIPSQGGGRLLRAAE